MDQTANLKEQLELARLIHKLGDADPEASHEMKQRTAVKLLLTADRLAALVIALNQLMTQKAQVTLPRVLEQIGRNAGEDLIPRAVLDSILKSYPDQAVEILQDLHHSHTNDCYFFHRWGMYVGVEYDGYIHT